jgi:uncharacterized protein
MAFSWAQEALAVLSGGAVGFSLGLIGGGGSILAVPLLLYVVGISDPHVAIGTSALSVAANAFANLLGHWHAGNIKWPCAVTFALAGVVGATIGSTLGKLVEGQQLLFLFALAMIAVGVAMLRPRAAAGNPDVRMTGWITIRLIAIGLVVGAVSGFFGIGGGFLIVPGLMLASGMPILNAIGSSLFSVSSFSMTTAINYALSDLIEWVIALLFIAGGIAGGYLGTRAAMKLATNRRSLTFVFAGVIFAVAIYMLARTGVPPWLSI